MTPDSIWRCRFEYCWLVLTLLVAFSCRPAPRPQEAYVVIELPNALRVDTIEIHPSELVSQRLILGRRLVLTLRLTDGARPLRLSAPGSCPLTVDLNALESGATVYQQLTPLIDVGPPRPELGFGQTFEVKVQAGCQEARSGNIVWRQVEGKSLRSLKTTRRGFVLTAVTPSFEELFGDAVSSTQLAVSPRTQGRVVLKANYTHAKHGQQTAELQLSAVSRSRGLPNVPTDASVVLGGAGWQLVKTPHADDSQLTEHASYSVLRPQTSGKWLLKNAAGDELALFSAPYSHMPLDCGRSDCHQSHTTAPVGRMSDVMLRGLAGELGAYYSIRCTLGCHSLGEPGLADGGFHSVQTELGFAPHHHTSYDDLPAALKRLSNVGCLGCHGPGAIPEPTARFGILSSAVCAYCHDAPPRYGHVAAWHQSQMSRAQHALSTEQQEDSACVRCHSTRGFLEAQGVPGAAARKAPSALRTGIDCVACHAVHQPAPETALLRKVSLPGFVQPLSSNLSAATRVCLDCHAPSPAPGNTGLRDFPEATATALWLGHGGYSESGEPLSGTRVHQTTSGCLTCHIGSGAAFDHGANHSFRASEQTCKGCHPTLPSPGTPERRARQLLERLKRKLQYLGSGVQSSMYDPRATAKPPHATPGKLDTKTPLGRAAYNLLLVLEDPAAGIHNPAYAELLLDHAERMIE